MCSFGLSGLFGYVTANAPAAEFRTFNFPTHVGTSDCNSGSLPRHTRLASSQVRAAVFGTGTGTLENGMLPDGLGLEVDENTTDRC